MRTTVLLLNLGSVVVTVSKSVVVYENRVLKYRDSGKCLQNSSAITKIAGTDVIGNIFGMDTKSLASSRCKYIPTIKVK